MHLVYPDEEQITHLCRLVLLAAQLFIMEDNEVPGRDIELALTYKDLFVLNPDLYTYVEPEEEPND
ncbi:hypothetical protein [Chamaesiphon sp. VAR_69_metabat_338]|uniref:hypothetical protein n=1 Tax=Chamaesiphon sp. VAR_69_metabat_338 TaxID=2964704 RepID=UPI00286E2DCF|nr:hypothetical protein [Chamaesiphon sp. VAR_69_metabat_338]